MIWNDERLYEQCTAYGAALVTPFDSACINPASIDLRLGASYRLPHPMWQSSTRIMAGDPAHVATLPTWGDECIMPPEGLVIYPGQFILCCSMETVCIPNDAAAVLMSKSSMGRTGLEHLHCIAGDTLIDVPRDVSLYPDGVSVAELARTGAEFDVYAFDSQAMSFVLAKGTAFKAKQNVKVVRVSYEWMTGRQWRRDSIVCTPDHRFLTLGGEWIQAQDLTGRRLRPFPRGVDGRYPTIGSNPLAQTMVREHRFIAESLYAPVGEWEVHHMDENKLNNRPDNLAVIRPGAHQRIHSAGTRNPFYGKQHTAETRQHLSEKRTGVPLSECHKRRLSEASSGENNPRYLPIEIGQIATAYNQAGTIEGAAVLLGASVDTLVRKIRNNGYSGTREFKRALAAQTNHKVYDVTELPEPIDTYDIHVPGYENFVANGVVIHNSGLGDPGFCGQWTWELHSVAPWPILLLPGKRYMQMVVHDLVAPAARDYSQTGRYQHQVGATPAREVRP